MPEEVLRRKFCSLECIFLKRKEFKGNKVSIYHKLEKKQENQRVEGQK